MKFKNEFLLGSVSNYYYLYHNHCFPKQSSQSTLTVFCLLRKEFWHLSFIPARHFHTVRINPFDLSKTFPLFCRLVFFVNFLSTYNEGISIFRFACYFQKFNKFIMLGRCDSMVELVANTTNGVIVKKFKWEEFVHIERKSNTQCVIFTLCVMLAGIFLITTL